MITSVTFLFLKAVSGVSSCQCQVKGAVLTRCIVQIFSEGTIVEYLIFYRPVKSLQLAVCL